MCQCLLFVAMSFNYRESLVSIQKVIIFIVYQVSTDYSYIYNSNQNIRQSCNLMLISAACFLFERQTES